jgi:hypothetical protein
VHDPATAGTAQATTTAAPTIDALGGAAVWEQPLRDAIAALDARGDGPRASAVVSSSPSSPSAAAAATATPIDGSAAAPATTGGVATTAGGEVATGAAKQWSAASLKGATYAPNEGNTAKADTHGAEAAVLIALTDEANPRVLLTRRSRALRKHAGEVSFPGGKRESCDPPGVYGDVVVALREALEEVHLHPDSVRVIGTLPLGTAKSGAVVRPIVGLVPPQLADQMLQSSVAAESGAPTAQAAANAAEFAALPKPRSELPSDLTPGSPHFAAGLLPQPTEIDRIFWVRLEDLASQEPIPYAIVWNGKTIHTPSFRLEGEIIWGLTGRMVSDLLRCGLGLEPHYWPIVMALRQGGTMTPEQKQLEEQTQSEIRAGGVMGATAQPKSA